MNTAALKTLLTSTIPGDVATYIEAQVNQGSSLDTAVRAALANLEELIPNPLLRAIASEVLPALLTVIENLAAKALSGASRVNVGGTAPSP